MNIAILGGSFDPPHKGHTLIAKRLLKLFGFDEIWLIPCYKHPFDKNLSDSKQRLEMTKCLEKGKTRRRQGFGGQVKVSDFEIRKKTISYTVDTLNSLTTQYPNDRFCWVIGTDQVKSFTKWKKWQEIINNFKLIVVPRSRFKKAERELKNIKSQVANPENIILIDKKIFPPIYISSTLIRKRAKDKKPISSMVPKEVEKYIIENKLYL